MKSLEKNLGIIAILIIANLLIVGILMGLDIIDEISNEFHIISIGIGLVFMMLFIIVDFDREHKMINTVSLIIMAFLLFKYINVSLEFKNTVFDDWISERIAIENIRNLSSLYGSLLFWLRFGFIKISKYIKSAYEEYDEKGNKKENKI